MSFKGKMRPRPQTEVVFLPILINEWLFSLCGIIFVAELPHNPLLACSIVIFSKHNEKLHKREVRNELQDRDDFFKMK